MNDKPYNVGHNTGLAPASPRLSRSAVRKRTDKKYKQSGDSNKKEPDAYNSKEDQGGESLLDIHGLLEILEIIKGIKCEQQATEFEPLPNE